jgi:hypothetical protein
MSDVMDAGLWRVLNVRNFGFESLFDGSFLGFFLCDFGLGFGDLCLELRGVNGVAHGDCFG